MSHAVDQHDHHHHHDVRGGAPVLDIGGDVGALDVVVDDALAGTELHLRTDDPTFAVHTGVWARPGGRVTTALFASLAAGTYWVLDADGGDVAAVEVRGGELAHLDLT